MNLKRLEEEPEVIGILTTFTSLMGRETNVVALIH